MTKQFQPAIFVSTLLLAVCLYSSTASAQKPEIQEKIAQLKQAMAENHQQLVKYQWLQTINVSIDDKTRKDEEAMCRYGADGKVLRTPAGPPDNTEHKQPGGLRGKIIAKKVGEMKEYTERLKSLISHYVPPQPEMIKDAIREGNANLDISSNGISTLTFKDYYKPGDVIVFGFEAATKKIRSYNINTYLDDPKKDIVTMSNQFASLPDGTNYLAQTILNAKAKQIVMTTTNTNYSQVEK